MGRFPFRTESLYFEQNGWEFYNSKGLFSHQKTRAVTTVSTKKDTTQFATFIFMWFGGAGCGSARSKKKLINFLVLF